MMAKRYELSDEAWAVVTDLFTETHGRGWPRLSDRLMLDGVLWALCSGATWRDIPERFGPWSVSAVPALNSLLNDSTATGGVVSAGGDGLCTLGSWKGSTSAYAIA